MVKSNKEYYQYYYLYKNIFNKKSFILVMLKREKNILHRSNPVLKK